MDVPDSGIAVLANWNTFSAFLFVPWITTHGNRCLPWGRLPVHGISTRQFCMETSFLFMEDTLEAKDLPTYVPMIWKPTTGQWSIVRMATLHVEDHLSWHRCMKIISTSLVDTTEQPS